MLKFQAVAEKTTKKL